MKLALDYDDTYTLDPEFWDGFIASAKEKGHEVVFVTMRNEQVNPIGGTEKGFSEYFIELSFKGCDVYYTNCDAKRAYMENLGIGIDVWIDDNPKYVENDKVLRPDEVRESLDDAFARDAEEREPGMRSVLPDTLDRLFYISGHRIVAALAEKCRAADAGTDSVARAIRWLGETDLPWGGHVRELIEFGLEHSSDAVRAAAVDSISDIRGPKALGALKKFAVREEESCLRENTGRLMKDLERALLESAYRTA